jgi:hypothetical protein
VGEGEDPVKEIAIGASLVVIGAILYFVVLSFIPPDDEIRRQECMEIVDDVVVYAVCFETPTCSVTAYDLAHLRRLKDRFEAKNCEAHLSE